MIEKPNKQEVQPDLSTKIKKLEQDGHLSSFLVHSFLEYLQRSTCDEGKATYTAKNSGMINKWVTVMSNAETDRVILKLRGKVN